MALRHWFRPKRLGLIAVGLLIAIQLVPVDRSNPAVQTDIAAGGSVDSILRRACYDCHSNETKWPWYSRVAPVSWFVANHVHDARSHLNFSEWPAFDTEEQEHLLEEMFEEVEEREMPLKSYLWLHSEARLSDEDRERLLRWIRPE